MMKDKKHVFRQIKNILYYGITLFLVVVIAISLFIPNGLVKVFGVGWYRVVSESMEPLIMTGDYIIVNKDTDVASFKDGDIIIFETHFYNRRVGTYVRDVVTHHFYKIDDEGYILTYPHSQFDIDEELRRLDEWKTSEMDVYRVKASDVIGRHSHTLKVTKISAFIGSPLGISIFILSTGAIIGFIVIYQLDKNRASTKEVTDELEVNDMDEESDSDVANLDE